MRLPPGFVLSIAYLFTECDLITETVFWGNQNPTHNSGGQQEF